jgi:hypothetical protein
MGGFYILLEATAQGALIVYFAAEMTLEPDWIYV